MDGQKPLGKNDVTICFERKWANKPVADGQNRHQMDRRTPMMLGINLLSGAKQLSAQLLAGVPPQAKSNVGRWTFGPVLWWESGEYSSERGPANVVFALNVLHSQQGPFF